MKRKILGILCLLSLNITSVNIFADTKATTTTKETTKVASSTTEQKTFTNLKDAAEDYAKVLQEVSNYSSREMYKTVNSSFDAYVKNQKNSELSKKWEELNTMLLEQYEVSVQNVKENGDTGSVIFLIKGYDEESLNKYLNDNAKEYSTLSGDNNQDLEIDIEKAINLQYNYLKNTKKVNLATSRVDFQKTDNVWKAIEGK